MTRYAIYFAPDRHSPLWQLGCAAIGYDAATAQDVAFPDHPLFRNAVARHITEEPRKYGFHATLKAPFVLKDGYSEGDLLSAASAFAKAETAFEFPPLIVSALGSFIALTPAQASAPLQSLAADAVRYFDPLRAPMPAEDRQRRLTSALSARQIQYLDEFGYPYVFEDFRFHMTLTGPLEPSARTAWLEVLHEIFDPLEQPLVCDAIAVFKQNGPAERFTLVERFIFDRD
eukprot:gene14087-14206_t